MLQRAFEYDKARQTSKCHKLFKDKRAYENQMGQGRQSSEAGGTVIAGPV